MNNISTTLPDLDDREIDMILAALRNWQASKMIQSRAILEIAEEHGERLSDAEIETLCRKINLGTGRASAELDLRNLGSLITISRPGEVREECLGFLVCADGKGVFDSQHGRVAVTLEQAEIHNKLLSDALVAGLDTHCMVGEGNRFYYNRDAKTLTTFTGEVVSAMCVSSSVKKGSFEFWRKGKLFRFAMLKDKESSAVEVLRVQ